MIIATMPYPRELGIATAFYFPWKQQDCSLTTSHSSMLFARKIASDFVNDTTPRNSHWLLIVDDEEAIRQSVGDYLFDAGYQVTACADAASAQEILLLKDPVRTTLPSCAILDIRMPGGPDGIELLQWIRSDSNLQRLVVILLTAKGMTEDRVRGYKAGCDFYLSKPFIPEELLSMVDAAVRKPSSPLEDVIAQVRDIKAQLQLQETATLPINSMDKEQNSTRNVYAYLTPSERNVVDLLCEGLTNQEIADIRNTSKIMVQRHLKNVYRKSGTGSRTQLVKWAIQNGFVPAKPPQR